MNKKNLYFLLLFAALFLSITLSGQHVFAEEATSLTPQITCSNGVTADEMTNSYYTVATFNQGDSITLVCDQPIAGLYICWNNKIISTWSVLFPDGSSQECGQEGYLHEYVALDQPSDSITLQIEQNGTQIMKLFCLSQGDLPDWVQQWDAPCSQADILLLSTHADDEQIFFGGILPYYAGELDLQVQVIYYTNYWNGSNIREHEKLDGLWTVGVHHYPVNGDFDDIYATSLEEAKSVYDYDATVDFVVTQIRRFKPLVLVGQDLNGEYGHGGHMITAAAICDAVEISMNEEVSPESAALYGCYEVPKTYLHLYPENEINLDCQRTLSKFDGKTVLDVAKEGYLQHQSQQWCWFYVSDDYKYSCAKYGLYRTTVGTDTKNDLLEHVTSYEEQARIEAEIEASKEAEEASIQASMEASEDESRSIEESSLAQAEASRLQKKEITAKIFKVIGIALGLLLLLFIILLLYKIHSRKKKRHKKRDI